LIGTKLAIFIKTILSVTSSSIKTEIRWNSHWMVLFQNGVRQLRSPAKMAATVQLRCYWKQYPNICETTPCHVAAVQIWAHFDSSNGQLKKFLFLVTTAILNGGRGCRRRFERDPKKGGMKF
jgi:hypothetical protein